MQTDPRASRRNELRLVPSPLRRFLGRAPELRSLTLRFVDPATEERFQDAYFRDNLAYIRLAHLLGVVLWAAFWVLARAALHEEQGLDTFIRFGLGVPSVLVSLALTYTHGYRRYWQLALTAALLFSGALWATHRALIEVANPGWGYGGLMLILAFCYIFARVQITYSAVAGALMIAYYNVVTVLFTRDDSLDVMFADFFLISFAVVGMAGAYGLERFARLLFLREQELDRERERSDELLANILPRAIVDRLKVRGTEPAATTRSAVIAEGLPQVTVVFADLVGFTRQAGTVAPTELVRILDEVFTRFDELAGRHAMEKIKTVGDAYMAVAGAPEPRPDHAEAAAGMALEILDCLRGERWPSGAPLRVRIGIASGPVVAGVIGRRKFAYDLWGDTVNVASRLESNGEPGRILVSEATARLLEPHYDLGAPCIVELKGKGPTPARFLIGRAGAGSSEGASSGS
jgi:class 3 adenylate cyclase